MPVTRHPHNKLLRTITFESTRPTELIRDPRVMPLPVRTQLFSMPHGVIDRVGAGKTRPYIP
jgi:hypothetical protein